MEKEKKITNSVQFNKLVEEMEKNPSLAKGFQKGSLPSDFKEQWETIATILNALGPPKRAGDGWQKVWRDFKFKVKKKLVANKAECTSTGGGIYKQLILSPLEEAVANLLQFQKQLNPKGSVQGVEFTEHEDVEIEVMESNELVAQNESEILPASTSIQSAENCTPLRRKEKSTSKKPGSSNDNYELLQKHSDEQAHMLKEINNSMSSIKRTLKDLSRYQKDLVEIEKKKYQLLLEENERKKEQHESEMKIKRIKLLIKEKELEGLKKS